MSFGGWPLRRGGAEVILGELDAETLRRGEEFSPESWVLSRKLQAASRKPQAVRCKLVAYGLWLIRWMLYR